MHVATVAPMRIRRVAVENFRGIKSCIWSIPDGKGFICLIGPGDSGKSSILTAIQFALSDRWNLPLTDADFFAADSTSPLLIRVTLTGIDKSIGTFDNHGFNFGGIRADGELLPDPIDEEGVDPCLTVQLTVDASLEPKWHVYTSDNAELVPIGASSRAKFGVFAVDERIEFHLGWGRGSALARLSEKSASGTTALNASRVARDAVFKGQNASMVALSQDVAMRAGALASGVFPQLRPGLSVSAITPGMIDLHHDQVPLARFGLGTRRLAGLSAQQLASEDSGLTLIDEIEQGLEPHRLVRLLRSLRQGRDEQQVIVSTHSPVAVEQLAAEDIAVVNRDTTGTVSISHVDPILKHMQASLRSGPSSFLAKRIVVGEGKTETGLTRGFVEVWDGERDAKAEAPSAALGVAIRNGGGSEAPIHAKLLADLQYDVILFLDDDDPSVKKAVDAAVAAGTVLVQCEAGKAIEDMIVWHLSNASLQNFVDLASTWRGQGAILDDLRKATESPAKILATTIVEWPTEIDARLVVALAAKGLDYLGVKTGKDRSNAWIKHEARSEELSAHLLAWVKDDGDSQLMRLVSSLEHAIYAQN